MSSSTDPFQERSSKVFAKLLGEDDPYIFDQEDCGEDDQADSDYKDTPMKKRQRTFQAQSIFTS